MCFALLPTAAFAAEDEGSTMPAYSGGSGTQDDPWLISSVEDLQTLASTINDGKAAEFDADCTDTGDGIPGNYHGYYFKQKTDLDLSSIENWDPIGYSGGQNLYFAGHYDGGGHTISNAKSTGKNDDEGFATAGIFGWVAFGSVKNLTVKNADFFAEGNKNMSYAGGVLAVAYSCSVENCSVYNSKIESRRAPNENSNYAGGITGIASNSSFEKCASVENTIRHGSFGGGFIGALDGGNSNFTNCYVSKCIVTGCSDTAANSTHSGGFQSASMDGDAILNNCFVYDCAAQPDTTSKGNDYFGVFTANTQYGKIVATSCFYYDANNATVNAEGAVSKTVDEFADGTVANLLGEAFAQGKLYPVFATDPADYTKVDAAIDKVNALNKDNYKDFSAVEAAVNAVVRDKKIAEQPAVDKMAKDIEGAIAALQYKDADYTKVDAAIAKANKLNKDSYQDFSAVEKAIADVVRDKNITEQSKVDAMAKAIEDAIAGLVSRPSSSGSSSSGSSKPSYSVTAPGTAENGSVTVSPKNATKGSTVTVTVKPDDGYQLDKLTVADAKGSTISVTDKGNGKYTFTMPASKVTVTPKFVKIAQQPTKKTFSDVDKSDWFADAVAYVTEKGLMNGTGSDTFSPNASTTRGMLMTVLARYAGEDTTGGAIWYEKGMNWAKAKGVSDGTNPEVNITREQLVTMLYRYAGSPAANGSLDNFSDAASVSSYAVNAMQWAVANGIVNGSNGKLNPKNNATRAEVAAILMRFCEMSK